jgi:DNA repair protein RecN (Recombination protein N)
MITNIRVRNVALIDEAEMGFGAGLNILTGETGAGKSILIDSITFLLGERPGRDFIRGGADFASAEGMFALDDRERLDALRGFGVECEDGQLLLSRSLDARGKNVCRVNGRVVTVGMMRDISALLVDVHGQHQHQALLDANRHIMLLDTFCGAEMRERKEALGGAIREYREAGRALAALRGAPGQREAQIEIWQFQVDEINRARLREGEEEALTARRNRLNGAGRLAENTREALDMLYGREDAAELSASDRIGRALGNLKEIAALDPEKENLRQALAEVAQQLSDVISELNDYADTPESDPRELERIEYRLDTIYRLKKKYGASVADILKHRDETMTKLERLGDAEGEINRLENEKKRLLRVIAARCGELTAMRERQAAAIQTQIADVLRELGMSHAQFEIQITKKKEFTGEGNDRVEFMLSPNLGEGLKPLSHIASGGEASRVMLALKTVMADADGVGTLIFDEIDAGVSGRTAQRVAEKLALLARGRQILCITHLPQIAAMADLHFLILKTADGGKTTTSVRELSREDAVGELARLIGGAKITAATLKAAGEMKGFADDYRSRSD